MNTRTKPAASHFARLLLGASLFAILLAPAIPAHAATEKYWVNLILTRGAGVSDELWEEVWDQFRTAFLPSFEGQLPGGAEFRVLVGDRHANFYLVNATTSNFRATYQSFRSIPGMIPVIPEMSVSVDGPYRGGPPPLAELTLNGKGNGQSNFNLRERVRKGRTKTFRCKAENTVDLPIDCDFRLSGTVFSPRRCRITIRDYSGRNVTARVKRGGTITPKLYYPTGPKIGFTAAIGASRNCQLRIRASSAVVRPDNAHPATLSNPKTMCRAFFSTR